MFSIWLKQLNIAAYLLDFSFSFPYCFFTSKMTQPAQASTANLVQQASTVPSLQWLLRASQSQDPAEQGMFFSTAPSQGWCAVCSKPSGKRSSAVPREFLNVNLACTGVGLGCGSAETLWRAVLCSSVTSLWDSVVAPCCKLFQVLFEDFHFEMILPVLTNSCHSSAYRAVPAPPSSKLSTQAALRIDPSVICPLDVKRKRPGVEMGKYKSCTAAVWSKPR